VEIEDVAPQSRGTGVAGGFGSHGNLPRRGPTWFRSFAQSVSQFYELAEHDVN